MEFSSYGKAIYQEPPEISYPADGINKNSGFGFQPDCEVIGVNLHSVPDLNCNMVHLRRLFYAGLFLYTSSAIQAQLCTGSLGDPVVNITFGSGSNANNPYTPPAAYTYTSSTCPNDGYYTITGYTSGCFNNNWHDVGTDHTGNGNFMLVNASYQPGDFFRATVSELCPNTTYEFAAWIMNVLKANGIDPDLTFRIEKEDGTVLGQYATGPISTSTQPAWQQYGFFFTTPPGNPVVVLRITNNAPGGIGNDLALDDITFRPCGPKVTASISGLSGDPGYCEYEQETLFFEADPSVNYISPAIQWQVSTDSGTSWKDIAGANGTSFTRNPSKAGHYWYRFNVAETGSPAICRINSNILVCNIWPRPLANAGPDRVLLSGDTLRLQAQAEDRSVYGWTPGNFLSDPGSLTPVASPPVDYTYLFSVRSEQGCTNEDWMTVRVTNGVYIPTAFTPNNDGLNDQWRIPLLDPSWQASVKIFNRYGQLVFEGSGTHISWDGNFRGITQPAGVYVYLMNLISKGIQRRGTITLIR